MHPQLTSASQITPLPPASLADIASPHVQHQHGSNSCVSALPSAGRLCSARPSPHPGEVAGSGGSSSSASASASRSGSGTSHTPASVKMSVSIEHVPNEVLIHILSHLPPPALATMSLVSRHFHTLVSSPHAWRIAFSRVFRGPYCVPRGIGGDGGDDSTNNNNNNNNKTDGDDDYDRLISQRRAFARLTPRATWRSEYVLRMHLLRALGRGRPAELGPDGAGATAAARGMVTYRSHCLYQVDSLAGSFAGGKPLFIHGASQQGAVSVSNPVAGKASSTGWGLTDHPVFMHFSQVYADQAPWGLGDGIVVGNPNPMDVSSIAGLVYGEGCPGGRLYYLSIQEKLGRFLSLADALPRPELGIPNLRALAPSVCSVWIARSTPILEATAGVCGILCGSSAGVLAAYSIGPHVAYSKRYSRGQATAKWVLCPGVPIISIRVDEQYSPARRGRAWAVVLNALGEVFYVSDLPVADHKPNQTLEQQDQQAWAVGRTARWHIVEPSRRVARPMRFVQVDVDFDHAPRSSSASMGLTPSQVAAETAEIERFLVLRPRHFQQAFVGWDMQRRLEVDFAADEDGAGECVVVIGCVPNALGVRRYSRDRSWHVSDLALDGNFKITVSALDCSSFAVLTAAEDPHHAVAPGQRARYLAVGTSDGAVVVWNVRQSLAADTTVAPIRVIRTDSPQVSCLALTSLYLVHGGSDGLVQAWDPLASRTDPVRTLSSRFVSRSRHRRRQVTNLHYGVADASFGFFGAGALWLDPDPTVLRGAVALGTDLRHWSYSTSTVDHYNRNHHKRRLLRNHPYRGTNSAPDNDRYLAPGRLGINQLIAAEAHEMRADEAEREAEHNFLSTRFGIDLLGPGATEEDMLAYATMLSEELSSSVGSASAGSSLSSATSSGTIGPAAQHAGRMQAQEQEHEQELDADLAEALRRSLGDVPGATADFHVPPLCSSESESSATSAGKSPPETTAPTATAAPEPAAGPHPGLAHQPRTMPPQAQAPAPPPASTPQQIQEEEDLRLALALSMADADAAADVDYSNANADSDADADVDALTSADGAAALGVSPSGSVFAGPSFSSDDFGSHATDTSLGLEERQDNFPALGSWRSGSGDFTIHDYSEGHGHGSVNGSRRRSGGAKVRGKGKGKAIAFG